MLQLINCQLFFNMTLLSMLYMYRNTQTNLLAIRVWPVIIPLVLASLATPSSILGVWCKTNETLSISYSICILRYTCIACLGTQTILTVVHVNVPIRFQDSHIQMVPFWSVSMGWGVCTHTCIGAYHDSKALWNVLCTPQMVQ